MAALTFATMLTAVRTRLGNPSTDGFFSDAQLGDMVNEALQIWATEHDWPWHQATATIATVAGTATYTPTAGWYRTKALTINGFDALELRSLQEIREYNTTETARPEVYCIENEVILLRPVPDAVYSVTHDYYTIEPELSGSAEPLTPAQFRWAIVEFACYLAHLRQGDERRASMALDGYKMWVQKARDNRRRSTSPIRVRVRPGGAL